MNMGIKTLRNNYSMGDFYFQLRCRGKYDTLYITSCTPRLYKKKSLLFADLLMEYREDLKQREHVL